MSNYDRNVPGWGQSSVSVDAGVDQGLRAYMLGVYNYMAIGLAVTGLAAIGTYLLAASNPAFAHMLYASPLKWVVMLAPLAFVFLLSARISSLSVGAAATLFFVYAASVGLSLSCIFLIFTQGSIARVFFITAATFGALSLYGYTTKKDLSAFGSFLFMGLVGLVIASLVNIFLQSSMMSLVISAIGVLVFAGYTAWDTQQIKEVYYAGDSYEAAAKKSIFGALQLYMDFLNLFMSLLNLMGDRD